MTSRLLRRTGPSLVFAAATALAACGGPDAPARGPSYDGALLGLRPVCFLHVTGRSTTEPDLAGHADTGSWSVMPSRLPHVRLPDGTPVVDFRPGVALTVRRDARLSISTTGQLSVVAWIRPDTLDFAASEGSSYVNFLGKGAAGEQEWTLRMYSAINSETPPRPNRVSGYVFNPGGGEGSGAYFQDPVTARTWIMVVLEVDTRPTERYPTGSVALFKDGALRGRVGLDQFGVVPEAGSAPLRVGTRDFESYFQGGIGDVAVFDRVLTPIDVVTLYQAMVAS